MAFRRFSRRRVRINRVASADNLLEDPKPGNALTNRGRAQSTDLLDFTDNCHALPRKIAWVDTTDICGDSDKLTEQWMIEWQAPLQLPFGKLEFQCRVEAVKSAVMIEMDPDSARDMRNYSLACRRQATCKGMLSPQIEKAASTLGILGL